jgi:hypothetical protein
MANLLSNTTIGGYQSIHTGNIGSYALTSVPSNVITTSGGQTIGGTTYFSGGESLNVYGIRGRFGNEYMHLYNKVGIGHPSGWGQGEGNTPGFGLSTYGGANFAYGNNADSTFNGIVYSTASFRAPIYYDSQNTNYYGDFASTSNLNVLYTNYLYIDGTNLTGTQTQLLKNTLDVTTLPYKVDITVNGDANTFYAVQFWGGDQDVWRRIIIKRGYGETAPWDPIGTGVHHGGLLLDWEGNFGGWGGAEYADRIRVFNESYTNVCADMFIYSHSMGYVFMLRGGGAVYHLFSDQPINGFYQSGAPDILYSTSTLSYDDTWSGTNQYDVPAPAPLTLAQVNSSRIDGLRTKKQSLLDGRYLRQGVDISGIGTITTTNSYATNYNATNYLATNAYYLNGTSYFLNSTNGGIYTNARFESAGIIYASGGNSSNWNTAYSWGNHASAGYLTSLPSHNHDDRYYTETESDGRFQPLENQRLSTGNSPTFVDIYSNNWFRNNSNNTGLYNQANGNHFYSRAGTQWAITSNGTTLGSLAFYRNHESIIEGLVYFDTDGFGLLNRNGAWAVRSDRDNTSVRLYHSGAEKLRTDGSGAYVTGRLDVSNYIYTPGAIMAKNIQGSYQVLNLDTIKEPGLYQYDGGIGGTQPAGTNWSNVKTIEIGSDSRYSQFVMPYSNSRIFYRIKIDAGWQSYVELITSGNIGSQSVSYATTAGALSSMNISQFTNNSGYVTSSSLSSYLPLAGGTMSGKIFTLSTGTGTYDGAFEIRETSYVTTSQSAWGYAPGITYHWGGRAASKVGLRSDGLFAIDDEPFATRSWTNSQGFLTSINSTQVTNALGYTPYNSSNPNGYITSSGNAATATILTGVNVTSNATSTWNPMGLTYQAWGQRWAHSSISADTGDLTLWLRPSQYVGGGTEVCMMIDGDYYAGSGTQKVWHAGNLTNLNQLSNGPGYITSYTETDTLNSVTSRGNTTGNNIITSANVYASVFYDYNDNGYYVDPNGMSKQVQLTNLGTYGSNAVNARNHFVQYNAGNAGISGGWIAAAFGDATAARVVIGQSSSTGATIGSHTGNLDDWAALNYIATTHKFYAPSWTSSIQLEVNTNGVYAPAYRGNANVGGTGSATWHPDGIYCGSTMWQYGSLYKNGSGIYDVNELVMLSGPYLQVSNSRNLIVKGRDSNDAVGILGQKSGAGFAFQLYGDGSNYGFLNGAWAAWDIRKTVNGAMYMNNNDSYYLHTNSTSNFVALNIQGNAVVHAGNIGSQSVSYAATAGSAGSVSGLTLTSSANGINPDSVTQNQIGYNTSVSLFGQTDGGLYSSAYSSAWIHQIYGDFRTGQIAVRGKNSGSWQSWRTVLDSSNYTSYSPSLTGSGASGTWGINVTGSAGSVAWTNVSSRPTALSQFTNDLGNYGGWLTTSGKAADSELIDGIDSSRIVYGDGDKRSTNFSDMNA